MSGHNNIYTLHAAALSRHAIEQKRPQVSNKKPRPSALTATVKGVFSVSPAPFSCNTTPRLQPLNPTQGTPTWEEAVRGGSARVDPLQKFSTIIPDYAYLQKLNNRPRANEANHQRRKATRHRKRLGCFSCIRHLSTPSGDGVHSRPVDLAANSTKYANIRSFRPVFPPYCPEDNEPAIIAEAPITPIPPNLEKQLVPRKQPSLKHPQPRPGWVIIPKIPRESLISPRIGEGGDVKGSAGTDAYSSELIVSPGNAGPSSRSRANSYTTWCEPQESLHPGKISVLETASSPRTTRPGRTGIPLGELESPRPRGRASSIAQQCTRENGPLQTTNRTNPNQPPLHPVPKNSIYQKEPNLCWGCEDAKSMCDKVTGLCKKCELYLVPCLEWTPDKMVQTPRTTMQCPQEVPMQGTYGQRSDSPTLGQSATHILISQPGAKGKGRVRLPVVYPPNPLATAHSEHADYVSPPRSHFSNTTIATSSCPPSPRSGDLTPFHYDDIGVLDKEIQALCTYWNCGTESSATSGGSDYTTERSREQVLLHPGPKAKGYIKCFQGPPSPMRLAESSPGPRPGGLTLPSLNSRQRSQEGAISRIYQHAENQVGIGPWMDLSGHDSIGPDEGQQGVVSRPWLEESSLTGSRLSRPASSIYSLYLESA